MSEELGFVYFIRLDGTPWVKIGYSAKPQKRLAYIKLIMPKDFVFTVVAAFRGTYEDESALHMRFIEQYDQGEWYLSCPALEQLIRDTGLPDEFSKWVTTGRTGRPRTVSHIPEYRWCQCADCRRERSKSA